MDVTNEQSLELNIAYYPDPKENPESKIQSLKPRVTFPVTVDNLVVPYFSF